MSAPWVMRGDWTASEIPSMRVSSRRRCLAARFALALSASTSYRAASKARSVASRSLASAWQQ